MEDFSRRFGNVRYCFHAEQGLSHARNRGWQEARGEYVAYVDDDCRVPEKWLEVAKEVVRHVSPGVFGGPYFAYYNSPKPRWFKDAYCSKDFGEYARFLSQREYLSGGNVFFRRALLQALHGFDPKLGMSGKRAAYGEETSLIQRIRADMPDQLIYYESRLHVYHLVRADKMTTRWIIRHRFHGGQYSHEILRGNPPEDVTSLLLVAKAVSRLLLVIVDLVYGALFRDRTRYPFFQNYIYEHTSRYLRALGLYYAQAQLLRNPGQHTKPFSVAGLSKRAEKEGHGAD